jgi:hypothetical protein
LLGCSEHYLDSSPHLATVGRDLTCIETDMSGNGAARLGPRAM